MLERYHQNGVELGRLLVFQAVAEELSFRGAADRLRLAQPAVSRQIRSLEEALDCQLFRRDTRGTRLTAAGTELSESLPRIFRELEVILRQAKAAQEGRRGRLVVGCSPNAINTYLPPLISRFREAASDVQVEVRELSSSELVEGTCTGKVDCAFVLSVEDEWRTELSTVTLFEEKIGVVLPLDHPAARRQNVKVTDLKDLAYLQFPRERNPALYDALLRFFERGGLKVIDGVTIGSRLQAVGRVAAGMGFTTLTPGFAYICGGTTVFRALKGADVPTVRHGFLRRKHSENPILDEFVKVVGEKYPKVDLLENSD